MGIYSGDDVASRDVFIAVVMDQAEREDLALAFRVSSATVGRVITRFKRGGFRAVADYGRRGGHTVRTPKLEERLAELFEKGFGPRAAHRAVAKKASYGTVNAIQQEWLAARATTAVTPTPASARRSAAHAEQLAELPHPLRRRAMAHRRDDHHDGAQVDLAPARRVVQEESL